MALAATVLLATACSASGHHAAAPTTATTAPSATPAKRPGPARLAAIRIDAIGLRTRVGEGLQRATLNLGPSHDPSSGLPGTGATVVIFGHRTTYTHPFFHIDRLSLGSVVTLSEQDGRQFKYGVVQTTIVAPDSIRGLQMRFVGDLLLVANTPLYSAQSRLVVVARPQPAA